MKEIRKVGIIKGDSNYDVMRSWCLELEKGFNKLGIEVITYDLKYQNITFFNHDVDFYITFNGWGFPAILDYIKEPIIMCLADHVNDHLDRIISLRDNDILTVMDRNDFNLLAAMNVNKPAYFLPHASIEVNYQNYNKKYDITFLGSYSNKTEYLNFFNELESLNPNLHYHLMNIVNECLNDSDIHYLVDGVAYLNSVGFNCDFLSSPIWTTCFSNVGRLIYAIERENVLLELASKGYNLTVFGEGWSESKLIEFDNVKIEKSRNYYESQKIIAESKILINSQPFLRDGAHERIFAGLSNSTYVLSNKTTYLEEFKYDSLVFYDLKNMNDTFKQIDNILSMTSNEFYNIDVLNDMKKDHTFESRAKELLEIYHFNKEMNI